jgi:hypothetical protein
MNINQTPVQQIKSWYRLNLSIDNAIKTNFVFPEIDKPAQICIIDADEIFATEWLTYMKNYNLIVEYALVFIRKSFQKDVSAHIDSTQYGKPMPVSLNWVHGIDDRDMVWYHTNSDELEYKTTYAGTRYYEAPISELTEIDRCRIGNQLTLVNTDTLHALAPGQHPRCCVTARVLLDPDTTWAQFVEQHCHLLIER